MKEDVKLPSPKDEDLIRYINSRLKAFKVHAIGMRMKRNKNEVHFRGSREEIQEGKRQLEIWMGEYYQEKKRNDKMEKVHIPPEAMGKVIGKGSYNLERIKESTGASIIVKKMNNTIYVSSENGQYKKAIFELRDLASSFMHEKKNRKYSCDKYDFVNSTDNCDFELEKVDCPNSKWKQTDHYYKITTIQDDGPIDDGKLNIDDLKELLNEVLEKIHGEMQDGKLPKADLWCHFGHIYISSVDEGDEGPKSLKDFQNNFNNGRDGWKMSLDPAVKDMEIQSLEDELKKDCRVSVPSHIRYDLTYLTPSCLRVRVKIFLGLDGKVDNKYAKEDIDIREGELSPSSFYMLCNDFHHRAKISIAIPSRSMDVRMTLRTVSQRKMEDVIAEQEHEQILKVYLDKIQIIDGKLVFPSEDLPEGFSLHFYRKCYRRSYGYKKEEETFSITVSDEEEMNVITGGDNGLKKTDIHLHNDKWDKLLKSGEWKPEQIINTENLTTFLNVLGDLQQNISAPEAPEDLEEDNV